MFVFTFYLCFFIADPHNPQMQYYNQQNDCKYPTHATKKKIWKICLSFARALLLFKPWFYNCHHSQPVSAQSVFLFACSELHGYQIKMQVNTTPWHDCFVKIRPISEILRQILFSFNWSLKNVPQVLVFYRALARDPSTCHLDELFHLWTGKKIKK